MKRRHVLLVDDDPAVLETLEAILSSRYDVTVCNDPVEAIELLGDGSSYDVVVADWRMPGLDGIEFLDRVYRLGYPIAGVLMTGHPPEMLEELGTRGPMRIGFITKPIDPARLLERVDQFARLSGMKRSVRAMKSTR